MQKLKGLVGNNEEEQGMLGEMNQMCSLSYSQRLAGFASCFILGWLIAFLALLTLPTIATSPEKFAILYTLGNLIAVASTLFLFGPVAQCKSMFKSSRWIATFVYFLSMGLTLFVAFKVQKVGWVILCMLFQFAAMIWYALSFIPYGRQMCTNMCKGCLGG